MLSSTLNWTSILELVCNSSSDLPEILTLFMQLAEDVTVVGYALRREGEDEFVIRTVVGAGAETLHNQSFSVGEGFLGQVVATKMRGYWAPVASDSRASIFRRAGISPYAVICHPVVWTEDVDAVIFAVSEIEPHLETTSFVEFLSLLIAKRNLIHGLDSTLEMYTSRFQSLLEFSRTIQEVETSKSLLYIVLDMSMNLVSGSFGCIAFYSGNARSTVELISRGISRQAAAQYGQDLTNRYIGHAIDEFPPQSIPIVREEEASALIECPLFGNDNVRAVLAVACDNGEALDEAQKLIYILSLISSVALLRVQEQRTKMWMRDVLVLHRATERWSMSHYEHAEALKDLVTRFAIHLGWSDDRIAFLASAAMLAPYDVSFVNSVFVDIPEDIRRVFQDWKLIVTASVQNLESLTEEGQLLALAEAQVKDDPLDRDAVQSTFYDAFERFLLRDQVETQEIILETTTDRDTASQVDHVSLTAKLTAREREILSLLITGKSNKEIAEVLCVSGHTVKNHLTNMFQKLGVNDRTQAIALMYRRT